MMKILVKYPTRARPQIFLERLKEWIDGASNPQEMTFLVSYDLDDPTMTDAVVAQATARHPDVRVRGGNSKTKIEACNADMASVGDWGVVLLISDDMFCRRESWDEIIRNKMAAHYPDTDGCLWFHDGTKQRDICTLSCIGSRYYNRFGFIYNPIYSSFFCDNEFTAIAQRDRKITFIEQPLASHEHPSWLAGMKNDALYQRNNKFWHQDQATYNRRKAEGFPK